MRLLLIGPSVRVIGGATVMFSNLLRHLRSRRSLRTRVVYSNPTDFRPLNFLHVAARLLLHVWRADLVMLNASRGGVVVLGSLVRVLASAARVPYVIRIYGGNFDLFYEAASRPVRRVIERVLSGAGLVLVETQQLVRFLGSGLEGRPVAVRWQPNSRSITATPNSSTAARDFYFAGHINRPKGVETILRAARLLRGDVRIHFFGAVQDPDLLEQIRRTPKCTYHGELPPSEVVDRIARLDALVFPTEYAGEGYPGVVVESILLGKPVISTRWRAIPEIVGENGILVDPGDAEALAEAMDRLHEDARLYRELSDAAHRIARRFDSSVWMGKLAEEDLPEAVARHARAGRGRTRPARSRIERKPG